MADLDIEPTIAEAVLPSYLARFTDLRHQKRLVGKNFMEIIKDISSLVDIYQ